MLALLLKLGRNKGGYLPNTQKPIVGCVGTAPLSPELHRRFEKEFAIPLFESYGLSETLFVSTQTPESPGDIGSVGKVLPGAHIRLSPDNEIAIEVPWLYQGYMLNKTEIAPQTPFQSGDLGIMSDDGYVSITGRKKDIIIRGGINISPRHIEEYLETCHAFDETSVIGFPDDILGERIVCFFVPNSQGFSPAARRTLSEHIRRDLGIASTIDEFVQLTEIPKLSGGKVDKMQLRNNYHTDV